MVPLIERVAGELGALVSVDTYKPAVARAAIAAGASIVNDVSGLRDPVARRRVRADRRGPGAHAHARRRPSRSCSTRAWTARIVDDVEAVPARADRAGARARGRVRAAHARPRPGLRQDAGADRRRAAGAAGRCTRSGARCCWPSRARTSSARSRAGAPRERLAGTLAAVAHGVAAGAHVLRVHDVAEVADFLAVRAALDGRGAGSSGGCADLRRAALAASR